MKKLSSIMFDDTPTEDSENAITSGGVFKAIKNGGGGGGTSDYNYLINKPKINNVELSGNKTLKSLGIASGDELTSVSDRVTQAESDLDSLTPTDITNSISWNTDKFTVGQAETKVFKTGKLVIASIIGNLLNEGGYQKLGVGFPIPETNNNVANFTFTTNGDTIGMGGGFVDSDGTFEVRFTSGVGEFVANFSYISIS